MVPNNTTWLEVLQQVSQYCVLFQKRIKTLHKAVVYKRRDLRFLLAFWRFSVIGKFFRIEFVELLQITQTEVAFNLTFINDAARQRLLRHLSFLHIPRSIKVTNEPLYTHLSVVHSLLHGPLKQRTALDSNNAHVRYFTTVMPSAYKESRR